MSATPQRIIQTLDLITIIVGILMKMKKDRGATPQMKINDLKNVIPAHGRSVVIVVRVNFKTTLLYYYVYPKQ